MYSSSLLFGLLWNIEMLYFFLSLILSVLTVIGLRIPQVLHPREELKKGAGLKSLPESREMLEYIQKIRALMEKDKPYLDRELTFETLSVELGIPKYILTHVLNKGMNQTFFDFINQYRLDEFLSLYRSSSSESIPLLAQKAGFSSKPTLYRVFKAKYGCSPSQYLSNKSSGVSQ